MRRALATDHPLISLAAFRTLTFRLSMRGGGFFRGCLSALPFLLPLLFQVGFGLDPVTSGTLVLGLFVGNLGMKPATSWLIRNISFRRIMLINASIAVATMLGCALLSAQTPHALIFRSAGVAVAGALLRLTSLGHGGVQTVADFHITIVVIAVLAVVATVDFFRVPANAGEGLR